MNKRDKIITLIIFVLAAFGGGATALATQPEDKGKKVTICHATSSEENPWVRIVVSENAIGGHFDNPGSPKAGHEDDLLLEEDAECPTEEDDSPEEPENGGTGGGQAEDQEEVNESHPTSLPAVGSDGK